MRLLFTTSDKIGAKLIRWGLDTDCSHFAVVFDETVDGDGIVFHSKGGGSDIDWFSEVLKKNRIVHALRPRAEMTLEKEELIYRAVIKSNIGQGYDYLAMLFWAVKALGHKLFKTKMPSRNSWQVPGKSLCTNLALAINQVMGVRVDIEDHEMIAPHELYKTLISSGAFLPDPVFVAAMTAIR